MKFQRLILILSSLVIILLLSGCSPWVVIEQGVNNEWISLNNSTSVGQTFVANYSGLQAVYFWLGPMDKGDGTLTMHLRSSPESPNNLVSISLPVTEITTKKQYRFNFPPISGSDSQYYYAVLEIDGGGKVGVGYELANSYPNGSAYVDNQPAEGQLSFALDYDKLNATAGIVKQFLKWLGYLLIGLLIFTIPGWAMMSVFWKGWDDLYQFEKIPISIGTSLALYALLILFTYLIHLQLGKWYVWLPIIFGCVIIIWKNHSSILSVFSKGYGRATIAIRDKQVFWANASLIIILGLITISRFWAMRNLVLPMWNDSLHHTEITQLILDNGGLFSSWMPYAPYDTFSMHFGFPLSAALFAWISGVASGQAVLIVGQLLNIIAPLALYPVVIRLSHGKRISGVIAVMVAGLLSPMPAYYINWGRYAQLAGQILLPIAMWMMWDAIDNINYPEENSTRAQFPWIKMLITAVLITGMILYEFRMIFVIVTFALAFILARLAKLTYHNWRKWLQDVLAVFSIGAASIIIFLPWGIRLQHSKLIDYSGFNSGVNSLLAMVARDYQTWLNIRFYIPLGLIILALLGLVWSVIKKDWLTASLGLWVALMASLYAFTILRLPWVQYVQSFAVLISLYIPVGILVGYITGDVITMTAKWRPGLVLTISIIIVLGIYGVWNQRNIADPAKYAFVTQPDMQAMKWISENTPKNSYFLIEGKHENWVTNVIGTDAGWWIPLLANRENTIPPQYALSNEQPIESNYSQRVVDLEASLEITSVASDDGIKLLCAYGISHVYIGQKQGTVGFQAKPLFTPAELSNNPVFQLIYHNDGVYVYSVENPCKQ